MKMSMRARRMNSRHNRQGVPKLNLVSLMDIFTILVFFLLVNSSDVEVLQNNKAIELPESQTETKPDLTLVIMVNNDNILVGGRQIVDVATALEGEENIAALAEELKYQAKKTGPLSDDRKAAGRPVTIMGDQAIPYHLLKRIMTTCASNEYRHIALAVSQMAGDEEALEG